MLSRRYVILVFFITLFLFFASDIFAYTQFPGQITLKLDTPQTFSVQQGQLYTINAHFSWDTVTAQSIGSGFLILYDRISFPAGSVEGVSVTSGTFPMRLSGTAPDSLTASMWCWSVSPNPPNPDTVAFSITLRGLQNTTVTLSQQALYYNGALTGYGGHGWGTIAVKFEYIEQSIAHTLGLNGMCGGGHGCGRNNASADCTSCHTTKHALSNYSHQGSAGCSTTECHPKWGRGGESYTGLQTQPGSVLQVNHASGNLYHNVQTTFSNSSVGYTSNLILSYNSREDESTIFGKGWTYNYGMSVTGVSPDKLRYKDWDGKRVEFTKTGVATEDGHTVTSYSASPSSGTHNILKEYKDQNGVVTGYILSKPNQEKEYFDAEGRLIRREDANGNNLTVACNANDITITTSNGQTTVINLTNGHVSSVTGPNGQSVSFTLTAGSQISTVAIMDNGTPFTHSYTYNAGTQMVSYTTPANQTWQMEYASPPVKKITQPDAAVISFGYSANTVEVTNTRGYKTTYTVDADLNVWRRMQRDMTNPSAPPTTLTCVWTRDYDAERNLTGETDAENNVTLTSYDANGNRISVTDPADYTETRVYNLQNKVESILQKNGATVYFTYDASGYNRTSQTDAEGSQTTYSYGTAGELISQTNARGVIIRNVYHDGNLVANIRDTAADTTDCTLCHVTAGSPPKPFSDIQQSFNTASPATLNIISLYRYNDQGFVTSRINPRGYEETYTLDIRGNRLSTQNTVTLQVNGLPQTVNITRYTAYNPDGYVTGTTDAMGHTTVYIRDYAGRVTYLTDAQGNTGRNQYDTEGNLIKRWDPKGLINGDYYEYIYNEANLLTESSDPKWRQSGKKSLVEYNRNGLRVKATDARGNSTVTQYDSRSLVTGTIDAKNSQIIRTYNSMGSMDSVTDAKGNTTIFGFDRNNRQNSVTDALLNTTRTFYDSAGNVAYSENGRGYRTNFEYDAVNRRTAVIDAVGNRTETSYDADSNVIQILRKDNTGDTLAKRTYTYNELGWQVTSTEWKWEYGTGAVGTAIAVTTTQIHNADGQVIETVDPLGNANIVNYDADHRVVYAEDALGNTEVNEFDENGNVTQTVRTELYTDPQTGAVTAEAFITVNAYNVINQMISSQDNMGYIRQWELDEVGNNVRYTDAEGNVTDRIFDELNRETEIRQYLKDETGAVTDTISALKQYDENSNLRFLTDDNGNSTEWTYDGLNRPAKEIMPDGTVYKNYTGGYDGNSNMLRWQDANGNVIFQQFDAIDRLTRKDIQRGAGVEGTTFENYTYDGLSRIVTAEDDDSLVEFRYDSLSRKREEIQNGVSVKSDYDDNGFRIRLTYPNGRVIEHAPDALNRIDIISEGGGKIADYDYAGPFRVKERKYQPNSINPVSLIVSYNANQWAAEYRYSGVKTWQATEYDKKGKPKKYDWTPATVGFVYDFDREGNKKYEKFLHEIGNGLPDGALAQSGDLFRYDTTYRLTGAKYGVQNPENWVNNFDGAAYQDRELFDMDNVGNRISVTNGTTAAYQTNNLNQYTQVNGTSLSYDANGSMTNDGYNTNITYDYTNLPVRFDNADYTVEMKYDTLGRRIEKKSTRKADGTIYVEGYVLDGVRVLGDTDSAGAIRKNYIWGNGIDELLASANGRSTKYDFYLSNTLGSITHIVNDKAEVQESYKYKVYGSVKIYDKKGDIANKSKEKNRHMFTGREWEPETGVYYYRTRYYNPLLARFVQRDRIYGGNSLNFYRYAKNSPANFADPLGLWNITRNSSIERGIAIAESGDTFEDLAKTVKLDPTEKEKWLLKRFWISQFSGLLLIMQQPHAGEEFTFPNVAWVMQGDSRRYNGEIRPFSYDWIMYSDFDIEIANIRQHEEDSMHVSNAKSFAQAENFYVKEDIYATSRDIRDAFKDQDIWGFWYIGHGSEGDPKNPYITGFSGYEPDTAATSVGPYELYTKDRNYKLGRVILNACYSEDMQKWPSVGSMVSPYGDFKGFSGRWYYDFEGPYGWEIVK